jgi:hypothetical protein
VRELLMNVLSLPGQTLLLLGNADPDADKVCYALLNRRDHRALYVGSTVRAASKRLAEHARKRLWFKEADSVFIKQCRTIDDMLATEIQWHHELWPIYAGTHKRVCFAWKSEVQRLGEDDAQHHCMCTCGWMES